MILQYSSAAVATPWEVGKTLLQVQYVPRNLKLLEPPVPPTEEGYEVRDFFQVVSQATY